MSELLTAVLTNPSLRSGEQLPTVAAQAASEFAPWYDTE